MRALGEKENNLWMHGRGIIPLILKTTLQFRNSFTSDLVNLQRRLEGLSIQPSQRAELIKYSRRI